MLSNPFKSLTVGKVLGYVLDFGCFFTVAALAAGAGYGIIGQILFAIAIQNLVPIARSLINSNN
jgi:hypothetical protein